MSTISSLSDSNLLDFKIQRLEGINKRQEDEIKNQKQALEQQTKALEQKDSELLQQKQQNIQQQKDFAKILYSMGQSIKQIADKLNISENDVKKMIE